MNKPVTGSELHRFLEYVESRNLSICNWNKGSFSYWPVDKDAVVHNFLEEEKKIT